MSVRQKFSRRADTPQLKATDPKVLTQALEGAQQRYDAFIKTGESTHYSWNWPTGCIVWSHGHNGFTLPSGFKLSMRDKIVSGVQDFLKSYQTKDHDHYAFCEYLSMWDISSLCSGEKFFRFPEFGSVFCVQLASEFRPHVVKIGLLQGELAVYLRRDICIPFSQFVETLRQAGPRFAASYDTQLRFWEARVSVGKEKFNYSGLPYELRWQILEKLGEDKDLWPFLWSKDRRCRYTNQEDVRRYGSMALAPEQFLYAMPGVGVFEARSSDQDMLFKMSIRRNTLCFDRPGHLIRFLDQVVEKQMREIRNIHLNFSHDDFLSLFGANIQPGNRHGKLTKVLKTLGQLSLENLWIEPKVSTNMVIENYFTTPQVFGCHSKAVQYICGLVTRNLQNAKKLRLCGFHVRPSWQKHLDDMFFDAKRAEFVSDRFYASKAPEPPHAEDEDDGGVPVSEKRRQPNEVIARAGPPVPYDAAIDLPPIDVDKLGPLWPCECHDRCRPDHFNNRDPPKKEKVTRKNKPREAGGPEAESGILGEMIQVNDALPMGLVQDVINARKVQDAVNAWTNGEDYHDQEDGGDDSNDEDDALSLTPDDGADWVIE
ncbi:uncharacterized protein BKCO1_900087 [Diplodia corticola]|uniref:Uncharacterized protein n=1 Tax=Diplodia corticola TaxID=236234 RepID=A0A1J9SAD4_9PEZI|nr:uncharacterized protein BKCO1_900087 [Diplodia corticola]OJD36844.1 hypothetical protein BKCO1_900087 [Diplodia corticola]